MIAVKTDLKPALPGTLRVLMLVAFRIVQAAGAALMTPTSLGLLLATFPADRRGHAVRTWTAVGGFAAALDTMDDFADALLAGKLQGFFEYISGQPLGCEEIACVRRRQPPTSQCVFVITAPERIEALRPFIGREPVAALLARLKA